MATHLEQSLQRDVERIRAKIGEMGALCERALRDSLRALEERNRTVAYSVILRDQRIDELEKENDRLCLEFMVRQQPVAGLLRLAYATIRINLELERVGDYAEGIARQVLKLTSVELPIPFTRYKEMADLCIPMLADAVRSFVEQDAVLAGNTMEVEERVDILKNRLNGDLMKLSRETRIPLETLNALMMIARHFERVSDQAKNVCSEVLYMCTGEYSRHRGSEATRLLFVDIRNACRSQMAEAIANSLNRGQFIFASAGLEPTAIDPRTVRFLAEKGLEVSRHTSKPVGQIPNLDHYQIIVALAKEAQKVFPHPPTKTVCLDWSVPDPSQSEGSADQIASAYEETYQFLRLHIRDLMEAVLGEKLNQPEAQSKT